MSASARRTSGSTSGSDAVLVNGLAINDPPANGKGASPINDKGNGPMNMNAESDNKGKRKEFTVDSTGDSGDMHPAAAILDVDTHSSSVLKSPTSASTSTVTLRTMSKTCTAGILDDKSIEDSPVDINTRSSTRGARRQVTARPARSRHAKDDAHAASCTAEVSPRAVDHA